MSTPAERILGYLNENGIKQTFIAKKIGVKPNDLNAKLHGKLRLLATDIEKICWATGKTPSDFLRPRGPQEGERHETVL